MIYHENLKPEHYRCSVTGATGVKLWRESYVTASDVRLLCREEALKEGGTLGREVSYGDQIGGWVPAVPCERVEGDGKLTTFWGYTSTPLEGVLWWYAQDGLGREESIQEGRTPQQERYLLVSRLMGQLTAPATAHLFDAATRATVAYWFEIFAQKEAE
jgi:hypothetical protein